MARFVKRRCPPRLTAICYNRTMEEYMLTGEGQEKFGWIRDNMPTESQGYMVLGYLYEHGVGTVDDIASSLRIRRDEVAYLLESLIIEQLVERR